ncbi:hypothetical protein M5E87_01610 [Flavonifractor plautii]|nr:hypothetical protein M5E87_01610 [Flavonifractor plautii]
MDANFVAEMNRTFDQGYDAVTCYRNSKNFAANWISATTPSGSCGRPGSSTSPHPAGHQLPCVGHRLPGIRPGH